MSCGFPCQLDVTAWVVGIKGPEKHLFGTHQLWFRCFPSVPLFSGWALMQSQIVFSSTLPSFPERLIRKDSKLSRGLCSPKRSFQRRESSGWGLRLVSAWWCRCGRVALPGSRMCGSRCSVPFGNQLHASTIPAWTLRLELFLVHTHVLSSVSPKHHLLGLALSLLLG